MTGKSYRQVAAELAARYPALSRGRIEGIMLEEHELLFAPTLEDTVPAILLEATLERIEMELQRLPAADVS